MKNPQHRVVIRRRRARHEPHHGGAWKIAYADFMTAMMAFFLVMWLLALVPQKDLKYVAEYFRMPLMTAIKGGMRLDDSRSVVPGGDPAVVPNPHPHASAETEGASDRDDERRLEDLKSQLENLIRIDPVLMQFRPQLLLDMTPDGLRVQIIDRQNRPMFATGSAQVHAAMRDVLRRLGPLFNQLPNSISIAGHTDSYQYASGERLYSNWELSADRANAARQELVAGGMAEPKIKRVLGLSSTVSLIKDDPLAAVNRRISIVVLNRRAVRRIDAQNSAGASGIGLDALLPPSDQQSSGQPPSGQPAVPAGEPQQ